MQRKKQEHLLVGSEQCLDNCAWIKNYTTARYHEFLPDSLDSGIVSEIK